MSGLPDNDFDCEAGESDSLDRLLGHSTMPQPDPWFVARTLARCRREGPSARWNWLEVVRVWRWTLGSGITACMVVVLFAVQVRPQVAATQQKDVQDAFQIVAAIDSDADAANTTAVPGNSL